MRLEIILVQEYIGKYVPDSNMASITHFKWPSLVLELTKRRGLSAIRL